ncbi:MAG TPA: thiamine pyrophosphate-dependent enzyme [Longimicrobiaceae bacterium]|nr:thiamine pyrophosphate-dependent enzyme [Longimicrobiaceae bacterium]
MLDRRAVLRQVVDSLQEHDCLVSALGYLSRDLYELTEGLRERAFYCMGSMGSVAPLALGVALGCPHLRVTALEGDGSLLMNLGTLASLRRYGPPTLRLLVFDNGCYESTGGQPSQPDGFRLEELARAAGLPTAVARDPAEVAAFLTDDRPAAHPRVLVVKVERGPATARVGDPPERIAERFSAWLRRSAPARAVPA